MKILFYNIKTVIIWLKKNKLTTLAAAVNNKTKETDQYSNAKNRILPKPSTTNYCRTRMLSTILTSETSKISVPFYIKNNCKQKNLKKKNKIHSKKTTIISNR